MFFYELYASNRLRMKSDNFLLTFKGKSCHAESCAELISVSIQHLVLCRSSDPEIEAPELDSGHGSG